MEKLVCASCPEQYHDEMVRACVQLGIIKAFGKSGDMINKLDGSEWIPKWQARVVQAVSQAAAIPGVKRVKIICIKGGLHCDAELRHQPKVDKAIMAEISTLGVGVTTRLEWLEFSDFQEDFIPKSKKVETASSKKPSAEDTSSKSKKVPATKKTESEKVPAKNSSTKQEASTATPVSSVVCGECDKTFKNVESFQQHQKGTGHITCGTCDKCFDNMNKLQQHISSTGHFAKSSLKTVFKAPSDEASTLPSSMSIVVCDECNEAFKNIALFHQHQEATKHITCTVCGKCFDNMNKLQQHVSSTGHSDVTYHVDNLSLETALKYVKPRVFGSNSTIKFDVCYSFFNYNCDPYFPPAIELLESSIPLLSVDLLTLFSRACDVHIPNRNNREEHAATLRRACASRDVVGEGMMERIISCELDLMARLAGTKALFDPMEISRTANSAIQLRERRQQLHFKSVSELKEIAQQVGAVIGKSEDKSFIIESILCRPSK